MKIADSIVCAVGLVAGQPLQAAVQPRLINPGAWLTGREAPRESLKRGERAMTAIDLSIAVDGSVSKCEVVFSSKSVVLDRYACTLFGNNARYEPAISGGNTTRVRRTFLTWDASKYAPDAKTSRASSAQALNAKVWVTTDDLPKGAIDKNQTIESNVALTISTKGDVSTCSVTLSSERPDLDKRVCALLLARAHYKPARDATGAVIEGVDWVGIRWQAWWD